MFRYYLTDTHDAVDQKTQKLLLSAPSGMLADRYAFRPCFQKIPNQNFGRYTDYPDSHLRRDGEN